MHLEFSLGKWHMCTYGNATNIQIAHKLLFWHYHNEIIFRTRQCSKRFSRAVKRGGGVEDFQSDAVLAPYQNLAPHALNGRPLDGRDVLSYFVILHVRTLYYEHGNVTI